MKALPFQSVDPIVPRQWAQTVVSDNLHCRQCGYDLRGLRADSRCPECGLEIWSSVLSTVDPDASRLPTLRNPRAVGNSLLVLTTCMLVGMLLLISPSIAQVIDAWDPPALLTWSTRLLSLNLGWSIGLCGIGLWALVLLAPPRGSEPHGPVWTDIGRIALGYTGWLAIAALWAQRYGSLPLYVERQKMALHVAAAVFATIGLIGLRGVFGIIGQRSREYRRSKGGRQSLELIIVAVLAGLIGALVRHVSRLDWFPGTWRYAAVNIGRVVMWTSNLMILIGLSYMVVNAWWIRRSLRRPPPPLDQVLMPQLHDSSWVPDHED